MNGQIGDETVRFPVPIPRDQRHNRSDLQLLICEICAICGQSFGPPLPAPSAQKGDARELHYKNSFNKIAARREIPVFDPYIL